MLLNLYIHAVALSASREHACMHSISCIDLVRSVLSNQSLNYYVVADHEKYCLCTSLIR